MTANPVPHSLVAGTVLKRIDWTPHVFSLQIQAPVAPFTAGQYTKLALPGDNGRWLRRAYSYVNPPSSDVLEFLLITVPDGALTPRLDKLKPGEPIWVGERAAGFMTLNEIPASTRKLWLLSTGTAVGPFLSMLAEPGTLERFDQLVLVHAVRTEAELSYRPLIDELVQRAAGKLHYVPVVSREAVDYALPGRIPALLADGSLARTSGVEPDPADSHFLICGNPAMVKDTCQVLMDMGYQKHSRKQAGHFTTENYW